MRSSSASRETTAASSPPMTALMPVCSTAAASAIALPRMPTRRSASSSLRIPAAAAAANSPTECPATPIDAAAVGQRVPGEQARGHDQGLSDLRVADAVGVPLGAGGRQIDACPLGIRGEAIGRAVQGEPGSEEAGGLGALSGKDRNDHLSILPRIGRRPLAILSQESREALCEAHRSMWRASGPQGGRRRAASVPMEPRISAVWRISASRGPVASQPMTSETRLSR